MNLIDYLQRKSSIDILIEISNHQGQSISYYSEGGTDKTKFKRIQEAASCGLVNLCPEPLKNMKRVYLTERGTIIAELLLDLACAWAPHLDRRELK